MGSGRGAIRARFGAEHGLRFDVGPRWRGGLVAGIRARGDHAQVPCEPRRTCIGCRRVASSDELVRIRVVDGEWFAMGRGPGRGAWFCASTLEACFDQAVRRKAISRALRISPSADALDHLRHVLHAARSAVCTKGPRNVTR